MSKTRGPAAVGSPIAIGLVPSAGRVPPNGATAREELTVWRPTRPAAAIRSTKWALRPLIQLLVTLTSAMPRRLAFSIAALFSTEGAAELQSFHQEVVDNLKLAFSVFMSGDVKIARLLVTEKATLRAAEFAAAESHLARLRDGRPESIESSSLHLDILRDLKRIHSHICSVAYAVLERAGELQVSRLKEVEPEASTAVAIGNPAASILSTKR